MKQAGKIDPGDRLKEGEAAAAEGQYEKALAAYIWFHDHALENNPAYCGVRLSFALSYWIALGEVYPPAVQALREIRDRKTRLLLSGFGDSHLFDDVGSINEHLQDYRATYDLFLELHRRFPDLASACASVAMPALIWKRDYRLAKTFLSDPAEKIRLWSETLNQDIADLSTKRTIRAALRKAYVHIYATRVREVIDVLTGVGEVEEAESVKALALSSAERTGVRREVKKALSRIEHA